jgi:hypothetical protein
MGNNYFWQNNDLEISGKFPAIMEPVGTIQVKMPYLTSLRVS